MFEQAAQIGVHDLHFVINTTQAAFSSIPAFVCLASSNKCFEKKKQQQEMHTFVCTLVLSIVSSKRCPKGKPSSNSR